jgi:predicted DNA-binding helix-hairpin-helix protein
MDAINKLKALSKQMYLEQAEDTGCPKIDAPSDFADMVTNAAMPGGKRITLLKTLLTSACERNCYYCPFRAGRNYRRASFKPDEMAKVFINLHDKGIVEGFFLSSGIISGGIHTQDKLIATAEILRRKYGYRGYLHLKIMPGAERDQVYEAMKLASRVSINLEAPNDHRLTNLAPRKKFLEELVQPIRWINEIRKSNHYPQSWNGRWPSLTTQFVVGGAGENDLELLITTDHLYKKMGLSRAYFSAFNPIPDTPLENLPATPLDRQNRLYQASFLLRDYGYDLEDLPFTPQGNLPEKTDPKMAWAQINLAQRPIEVNYAPKKDLLRIPGIGLKSANLILKSRKQSVFRDLNDLRKIGINTTRAAPFILIGGKRPSHQLYLW